MTILSLQRAALVIGSLAAFYFIGNYLQHGRNPEKPRIFQEAECQRARLDAEDGRPDPQLLNDCRKRGFLD